MRIPGGRWLLVVVAVAVAAAAAAIAVAWLRTEAAIERSARAQTFEKGRTELDLIREVGPPDLVRAVDRESVYEEWCWRNANNARVLEYHVTYPFDWSGPGQVTSVCVDPSGRITDTDHLIIN